MQVQPRQATRVVDAAILTVTDTDSGDSFRVRAAELEGACRRFAHADAPAPIGN